LAAGLLAVGVGFLQHTQAIFLVIGVVLAALMVVAPARRAPAGRLPRQTGGRPVWRGGRLRRAVCGRVATVGPGRRVCMRAAC